MAEQFVGMGVLRVVPPAKLDAAVRAADEERAALQDASQEPVMTNLAGYIRSQFDMMKRHRNTASGWTDRLLRALRTFNGVYDPTQLAEIKKFGGSEVYARIIAMKCRGASSLLRDVYLAPERPWGLDPSPDPEIPETVMQTIMQLVDIETATLTEGGAPIDPTAIRDRTSQLVEAARQAAKKRAERRTKISEDKIDEILIEGNFYKALAEFITDLPLFPFAVMKGPYVKIVPTVRWENGQPTVMQSPRLMWSRISPFDIWFTPGVSDIEDAAVIERSRLTRADLNDLLDLPGYNQEAIRSALRDYGQTGLNEDYDAATDSERAWNESRESPFMNESHLISCLEYHGNVQGQMLLDYGMDEEQVPDPERDYFVQCWLVGQYVIKVQMSPSPRKRHPYFVTSFEKVPGTVVGNGLPDILNDIQDVCNASLRALVNNLSISSGPQVVVNDDRLSPDEDGEELYPWKRWHVQTDPMGNNGAPPISFFQPNSNASELLGVYQKFSEIADEISAIPRYLSGAGAAGAGRTASGLAMLMGNASKVLQTVAANIDRDILDPLLRQLLDMILLTDETGMLSGDETVKVMGVSVAVQKETQRSRQLEFLQITANPIDSQIVGPKGRAALLRAVSETLGLPGSNIVPSEDDMDKQMQAAQMQAMAAAGGQAQGGQAPQGGNVTQDMGPRTSIAGGP
jgi:hypothetical protein